ncbi:MAG: PilN domain-containing protein, partial [Betaproteobacteria bacterium]
DAGGFGIFRFDGVGWQQVATAVADNPEALAKALGAALRNVGIERFSVGLPTGQFLARTINLPQAAEENLRGALRYEIDRHTPFKADDVGFDCCVVARDDRSREITALLVISPKATISQAVASVAGAGLLVTAVRPSFPDRAALPIDLLPRDDSANDYLKSVKRWTPWILLAVLGLIALSLPIYQKRAQVIALQPQVNLAAQQAQAADALHQQLDRSQAEYNFLLQKRYATPTSLQLLNEVTRILPDDTWLQSFELRAASKGRELQLQGETGVAGKMIELFEQSPLLAGASFKSPVTQAPGSQASRFHIGTDVKEVPPPAPRALALIADTAASAAGAVPVDLAPAPGRPPPSTSLPVAAPSPAPPPSRPASTVAAAPAPAASDVPRAEAEWPAPRSNAASVAATVSGTRPPSAGATK